jgi:hypothetical protein
MSLTTSEMTPADIRACTGGNDNGGMWGGDWLAYILLFALLGGGGFGGFGGFGGGGILPWLLFANNGFGGFGGGCGVPATQADLAAGFNNSAVLSGINGIDSALCQGFNGLNTAFLQGVNGLERQIADCCCATQRAIDGVNYNLATQACDTRNTIQNTTRDIIDNANANSRAILDFLTKDKIDTLQSENLALRFAASQSAQNAFITANQEAQTAELIRRLGADCPTPAYVVQPPQPVTFPTNCCGTVNYASGCNNGCGSF